MSTSVGLERLCKMSNRLTTTFQYSKESLSSETPVIIDQQDWSLYTGKVTKQEVVKYLLSVIGGRDYEMSVDCGMAGDELVTIIYCYTTIPDVKYDIYTSYGELSERYVEQLVMEDELVQFRLSDRETTQFPAKLITKVSWVLQCLDKEGNEVDNPELTTDGQYIVSGSEVYGTAKVTYSYTRHSYILTAPRREEALDNNYSGVIVAVVPGYAPAVFELEMPPTARSFIGDSGFKCGGSFSGFVREGDGEIPVPEAPSRDLVTVKDYCTQTVIREYLD